MSTFLLAQKRYVMDLCATKTLFERVNIIWIIILIIFYSIFIFIVDTIQYNAHKTAGFREHFNLSSSNSNLSLLL